MKENLLSVKDISKKLKVTTQYVRQLIRNNSIKALSVGNQRIITEDDLNNYMKEHNIIIEPDDHSYKKKEMPNITALSFFSGAMGLDIGMNNVGIPTLLACESNKYCRMTINENNKDIALIGDITKYTSQEILKIANIPEGRKVDIIFGGPPCQAFSTAGSRRAFDDERGNVFLHFLDIIGEIKPTYIVIENVRGLLSASYPYKKILKPFKGGALLIILDKLRSFGYNISFNLYNAANYGAPQTRERVILIGKLNGNKLPYLQPTHSNDIKFKLKPWHTLQDAFSSLKPNTEHHYIEFPEKRLKYYKMLTEGQYWKHLPLNEQKEAMGKAYYLGGGKTGFYRRLSLSKPSPTLVTNPTMPATDLCHPICNRPLSIEEYKAIQGFPTDWKICGSILEQYKQIGNAVPIKLGEAIGKAILDDMNNINQPTIKDFKYSRYLNTNETDWEYVTRNLYEKLLSTSLS